MHNGLAKYYRQTTLELGEFYNFGNILNPSFKTTMYFGKDKDPELAVNYKVDFVNLYNSCYAP